MTADSQGNAYAHVVLTPFYVRRKLKTDAPASLADHSWLRERIELFKQYCLPTMKAQADQSFVWLIFFDQDTPGVFLDEVRGLLAGWPNFRVAQCPVWSLDNLRAAVSQVVKADIKWILTTRLDNDDGLAVDFMSRLRSEVSCGGKQFYNFTNGVILWRRKFFSYTHKSNAFISLMEPTSGFSTVYLCAHESASEVAPIRQIGGRPSYLQVVHGGNVSNKPRGFWIASDALARIFSIDRGCLPNLNESPFQKVNRWIFNSTFSVAWLARDLVVRVVKGLKKRLSHA